MRILFNNVCFLATVIIQSFQLRFLLGVLPVWCHLLMRVHLSGLLLQKVLVVEIVVRYKVRILCTLIIFIILKIIGDPSLQSGSLFLMLLFLWIKVVRDLTLMRFYIRLELLVLKSNRIMIMLVTISPATFDFLMLVYIRPRCRRNLGTRWKCRLLSVDGGLFLQILKRFLT